MIYVTNYDYRHDLTNLKYPSRNNISFINGSIDRLVKTISVLNPRDLAINPTNNMIYTVDGSGNEVNIIDGFSGKIIKNLTLPQKPFAVDVNPIMNKIYVTNDLGNRISVINGKTNEINGTIFGSLSMPPQADISVDPRTNFVYLTIGETMFRVIDGNSNQIIFDVTLGKGATGISVDSSRGLVYVSYFIHDVLYVINGSRNNIDGIGNTINSLKLSTESPGIKGIKSPSEIVLNPVTNIIYTLDDASGRIYVIDGKTEKILDVIIVGKSPSKIAFNPETNMFLNG
jgi:YVTN family beta-propeller protein